MDDQGVVAMQVRQSLCNLDRPPQSIRKSVQHLCTNTKLRPNMPFSLKPVWIWLPADLKLCKCMALRAAAMSRPTVAHSNSSGACRTFVKDIICRRTKSHRLPPKHASVQMNALSGITCSTKTAVCVDSDSAACMWGLSGRTNAAPAAGLSGVRNSSIPNHAKIKHLVMTTTGGSQPCHVAHSLPHLAAIRGARKSQSHDVHNRPAAGPEIFEARSQRFQMVVACGKVAKALACVIGHHGTGTIETEHETGMATGRTGGGDFLEGCPPTHVGSRQDKASTRCASVRDSN